MTTDQATTDTIARTAPTDGFPPPAEAAPADAPPSPAGAVRGPAPLREGAAVVAARPPAEGTLVPGSSVADGVAVADDPVFVPGPSSGGNA
ncbi:hypothetical protein ACFVZW_34245, partial [Streptomyces sp. NPDC059567]